MKKSLKNGWRKAYIECETVTLIGLVDELEFDKENAKDKTEEMVCNQRIEVIEQILREREEER